MKKWGVAVIVSSLCTLSAYAQSVSPEEFVAPQDNLKLESQAQELYTHFDKVTQAYGESIVYVGKRNRAFALGVIVAKDRVLTKWSDLTQGRGDLLVQKEGFEPLPAQVIGGSEDHDLILLEVPGLNGRPVRFSQGVKADEGDFLLTVLPNGQAGDFGVVSVGERSLRDTDLPYLGIVSDTGFKGSGARIAEIEPGSSAEKSGIKAGDVMLKLNGKEIDGPLSIRAGLKDKKPLDMVKAEIIRDGQKINIDIVLSRRPAMQSRFPTQRIETMNAMGNPMSLRRDAFPLVVQTDMTLTPSNAGTLVVGIDGKVRGIALSRAGRVETYILPASLIAQSLDDYEKSVASGAKLAQQQAKPQQKPKITDREERFQNMLRQRQRELQKSAEYEAEIVED